MRCLVTGAYGFIGREIVRALRRNGHEVVAAGRDLELGRRLIPDVRWVACDFNRDVGEASWRPRLEGIEAVVNAVGILQSTSTDDAEAIHVTAPLALYRAAFAAGARCVVHVSAISADAGVGSAYAETKARADREVARLPGRWVVVKPSLVIGDGSFGGTSLIRGLAGLPLLTPVPAPGTQPFQPIAAGDLAEGIARLLVRDDVANESLDAAGPEVLGVREVVETYRHWLGFPPVRTWIVPGWLMRPALWLGDLAAALGSPSAMRSTSMTQMAAMPVVDPRPFLAATGVTPRPLAALLADRPATIQDRLHARIYFVRPALQGVLALFWMLSGAIAMLPGPWSAAVASLTSAGVGGEFAAALVGGGALADLVLGAMLLRAPWTRIATGLQLVLCLAYLMAGTIVRPDLWADPLGPYLKILPAMAAGLVLMALAEKR